MIRGHSGSLLLTMWWTFTTSSMPVYAGAFAIHKSLVGMGVPADLNCLYRFA